MTIGDSFGSGATESGVCGDRSFSTILKSASRTRLIILPLPVPYAGDPWCPRQIFKVVDLEVLALQGLDLQVERGELIAIVGSSGSGKSTPQRARRTRRFHSRHGRWAIGTTRLSDARMCYRREMVGFVWQQTGRTIPYLTALENVELPMIWPAGPTAGVKDLLGVAQPAHAPPAPDMSGGEQRGRHRRRLGQRTRAALADEPTGSLDSRTGAAMLTFTAGAG